MSIDQAILDALTVNMGHREGESVAIVAQRWDERHGEELREHFETRYELALRMRHVFKINGYNVTFIDYVPDEARHGADAGYEAYEETQEAAIVFMPTAFSLTHTPFREALTERGARVASMPLFTLEMFEEGGPMSVDYKEVERLTHEVGDNLRDSRYVRVTGKNTDIVVEIDQGNIHASAGIMEEQGEYGNLPGAEAFAPPTHLGDSNGYFTVPAGWGGSSPLKHEATFHIKNGRFVDVVGHNEEAQRWIDEHVKSMILQEYGAGENYDVLAELGIGTNPNVTPEYINEKGWNLLLAEKIIGSAHFANGNSKGMGGQNDVAMHVDWVVPDVKIEYSHHPI